MPHLPGGVGLALAFHRAVYTPLAASKALEPVPAKESAGLRLAALALAPVLILLAGEELGRVSGWHTDIPAMLGGAPAATPGFLGLRTDAPYLVVRRAMDAIYGCYLQPGACLA